MVADKTETKAPPTIALNPVREIISFFSGAKTPNPPNNIPIEEILANPHKI